MASFGLPLTASATPDVCDAYGLFNDDETLTGADLGVTGELAYDFTGYALAALGDVNGDGHPDYAVAAPGADPLGHSSGAVYLFYGPAADAGDLSASEADVEITGLGAMDLFGTAVAAVGDVDGDGIDDFAIGAPGYGAHPTGYVALFAGSPSLPVDLSAQTHAAAIFEGSRPGDLFGLAIAAADLTGDGVIDLAIGAPKNDSAAATPDPSPCSPGRSTACTSPTKTKRSGSLAPPPTPRPAPASPHSRTSTAIRSPTSPSAPQKTPPGSTAEAPLMWCSGARSSAK